jgi:hypothetical protein
MNKKIFFYANFRTYDLTLGITRKVYAEINAFRKQGYEVYYSGYLSDGVAIFNNNDEIVLKKKYLFKCEAINHILRRSMLMGLCVKYLSKNDEIFNFSYARYHFFDYKYIKLLKTLKQHSKKVIIEAHSSPKFSKKISIMSYIAWKDSKWNKKAKQYVDLVASMSDEEKLWGIDTVKISNGIDVNSIKIHNYSGDMNDLNLIAVSFEGQVHGYDRVIKGIYNYYKNGGTRKIIFHIVGTTLASTDALISKLKLEKYCIKYGPKSGKDLDDIYDKANLAVGCLANHRIGSYFGSALKTKEYIAKGIPFIYGWKEKVLDDFQYGLQFELCEEPIDFFRVIEFYDNLPKLNLAENIRSCLNYTDTWDYQIGLVLDAYSKLT